MIDTIPPSVRDGVGRLLPGTLLRTFQPVSGGCINHGGKLSTSTADYFIKWNDRSAFPSMFETEAKGLRLLRESNSIRVNDVIGLGEQDAFQFIVLEWISGVRKSGAYWSQLGRRLADLHRHTSPRFGLDHDNYIGSLQQSNSPQDSWIDFFVHQRLEPQIRLATDNRQPVHSMRKKMDSFFKQLPGLMPVEPPALVHGDLWSGNLIVDEKGNPCVIDPSVYFGHREAELSYTQLFGRFDAAFYTAYAESFPLTPGLEDRADLYKLYPLLVHVNLFGAAYVQQAEAIVDRFV